MPPSVSISIFPSDRHGVVGSQFHSPSTRLHREDSRREVRRTTVKKLKILPHSDRFFSIDSEFLRQFCPPFAGCHPREALKLANIRPELFNMVPVYNWARRDR
ncbi:unnamed protein product [Soboliphyme baturini]|uniref:Uncharacterized protein n=1 Tax=Soboliphyme baturini TaxID=241478 RepID=A0A183ID92_9BILA|nr:unnamed protein product [Soboliphyme baturini]